MRRRPPSEHTEATLLRRSVALTAFGSTEAQGGDGLIVMCRVYAGRHRLSSHTRTVVRVCCKGEDASQWENGKFDLLPRPNPLTDRQKSCTRDYVMDIY